MTAQHSTAQHSTAQHSTAEKDREIIDLALGCFRDSHVKTAFCILLTLVPGDGDGVRLLQNAKSRVLGKDYDHTAAVLGFARIEMNIRYSQNLTEEERQHCLALIEAAWNLGEKEPPRA